MLGAQHDGGADALSTAHEASSKADVRAGVQLELHTLARWNHPFRRTDSKPVTIVVCVGESQLRGVHRMRRGKHAEALRLRPFVD